MAKATKKTAVPPVSDNDGAAVKAPAKRAAARSSEASAKKAPPPAPPPGTDLLSQTVLFCQEQRWREALGVCRRVLERARNDGNDALVQSMTGAQTKIEYSLRRQMAAAAAQVALELVQKEFQLNVASE